MLNRQQLTITAVSQFLTDSTDFALSLVNAQKADDIKDQQQEEKRSIPWKLLLVSGGSAIAGIITYMKNVDDISGSGEVASDTEPESDSQSDDDSGEGLLDTIANWFRSIPNTKADLPKSMPQAPAITSTDRGSTFIGTSDSQSESNTSVAYIRTAAQTIGVDPELAFSVAKIESNLKVQAKNRVTGATGLYQFTPSTWRFLIKKYSSLGFSESDVNDPRKNAIMGAVYLKQISETLRKRLGRSPSATEVYLGHFLGPSGALLFTQQLGQNPQAIASDLFPAAAKSNPNIFFDGQTPRTLAQVFDLMNTKVSKARDSYTVASVERAAPVNQTTVSTTSVPSAVSLAPVPQDTSIFLSSKVTSRVPEKPVDSVPITQPEPAVSVSSSPPMQAKTFARNKQGILISLSTS